MATKQGFKVLDSNNCSFYVSKAEGGIEYKEDEWVEPFSCNGPLGVFDSYDAADEFIERGGYGTMYGCEYEPSDYAQFWYIDPANREVFNRGFCQLPPHTVFADRVKIKEPLR